MFIDFVFTFIPLLIFGSFCHIVINPLKMFKEKFERSKSSCMFYVQKE